MFHDGKLKKKKVSLFWCDLRTTLWRGGCIKGGMHPHNKFTHITYIILICTGTDRSLQTVDNISQLPDGMFQIKSQTNFHIFFGPSNNMPDLTLRPMSLNITHAV